jgi:hypothetical protein
LQPDVLRGRAYENSVDTACDVPYVRRDIIVSQRAPIQVIVTFLDSPGCRDTFLNPLSSFNGRVTGGLTGATYSWAISAPGRFPVLVTRKLTRMRLSLSPSCFFQSAFVKPRWSWSSFFQYERINVEIRVPESRVRQSVSKRILRLNMIFFVSPIAYEKAL